MIPPATVCRFISQGGRCVRIAASVHSGMLPATSRYKIRG